MVPAFTGLGAPYWDPYARGAVFGLTRGTSRAHLVRATVESLAYQARDVIQAMEQDAKVRLNTLKVDGGASANNFLMQFQANLLDSRVVRPSCIETTALGAAYLAGLSTGFWNDAGQIEKNWKEERSFLPDMREEERERLLRGWSRSVGCVRSWAEE